MPISTDTPTMEVVEIFAHEPEGPFAVKEIGEGFILSNTGAVTNAVHDATGVWIKDLRITPKKIIKALEEKREGGEGRAITGFGKNRI